MQVWSSFTTVVTLSLAVLGMEGCPPAQAADAVAPAVVALVSATVPIDATALATVVVSASRSAIARSTSATVAANPAAPMDMGGMDMGGMDMGAADKGPTYSGSVSVTAGVLPAASTGTPSSPGSMPPGPATVESTASPDSPGQAAFNALKTLFGKWDAPMGTKTLTDTFQPFAFGTAILAEEWLGGQQITATVFYMVGSELRADHYCDYGNQPRYVAAPSTDPSVVRFEFREATNLDTHPTHFHSTTWHLIDATHMTQDWNVEGSPKGNSTAHLQFVRRE